MLTLLGYGLVAVLLGVALFLLAAFVLPEGEQIAPVLRDEPIWDLPGDRRLYPNDVASARLPVALRGYRFAETDSLLDRLGDELKARDAEIARLRGLVADGAGRARRPGPEHGPEHAESSERHAALPEGDGTSRLSPTKPTARENSEQTGSITGAERR